MLQNCENYSCLFVEGKKKHCIFIKTDKIHLCPENDIVSNIVYSANGADVDTVIINGKFEKRFALDEDVKEYVLFESDTEEKVTIRLIKLCEAAFGKMGIISFIHDGIMKPTAYKNKKIEFIGDSITCGYGIEAKNLSTVNE